MKSIQPLCGVLLLFALALSSPAFASSHREAPLIADDPLADNVDVYAFRSPQDSSLITLVATFIPMQLPHGGPNYYHFGEDIRYEIHVDNNTRTPGDEITYRFTFTRTNEDPTTFFNVRLGQENLKTTYRLEMIDGEGNVKLFVAEGEVPAPNIGPRSITSPVGLGEDSYGDYADSKINSYDNDFEVFVGPVDDPFFVDLGGIFDLGDAPRQDGDPVDGLACFNTSAIVMHVPIRDLLKRSANEVTPNGILDPDYIIGVWASTSRPRVRVLQEDGSRPEILDDDYVQVSRLGMPLTNEAVIPVGMKDYWNSLTPHEEIADTLLDRYFYNPELALYMDPDNFAAAVPAFAPLRIQENSLGAYDFTNGADGLYGLKGNEALDGTALADNVFGDLLLPGPGMPRSVDLWPIFHTGVPNMPPYQLATGKDGNPLAAGKPFINNFLPNGGDMLRLNMAVPATDRDSDDFSSLGLVQAAVLGLTDPRFNGSDTLQFIPNMDGFPNGRRLEDDVTRIELQAVSGVVLAAIGLWYDDYDPASDESPVTAGLTSVLGYTTGVEANDEPFRNEFPFLALPHSGVSECSGMIATTAAEDFYDNPGLGIDAPNVIGINFPNPFQTNTTIKLRVREAAAINIDLYDVNGRNLSTLVRRTFDSGEHRVPVQVAGLPQGVYFAVISGGRGEIIQTIRLVKTH
ncbi:putative secreted protein (Por secretion system target) [Neolewinella xylanilytica]|uniref:Putative secreted protein (Por secretion system target) n=1 Tax=Neolewinella xylanilytica TaxID=1514080 RepID=A0A2S6I6C6_9BACT|nr:DUF4331 family protein [Neolewinella xylanilytica]PPK86703.1 putative secreted protein (Por secretion system target) [Neolewinella xylanilytica]